MMQNTICHVALAAAVLDVLLVANTNTNTSADIITITYICTYTDASTHTHINFHLSREGKINLIKLGLTYNY